MAPILDFLRSSPYFASLTPSELERVAALASCRSMGKDEVLFLEGEPAQALYFVLEGRVKIYKSSPEGKEQILRIMHPGESFNEVPIFDGGSNPASAATLEPATVLALGQEEMAKLLRDHPQVAANALKVMASRLRQLVALVEDLSLRQVMSRVAKVLLELEAQGGESRLTQQQMAALVGTAREMVSRSLRALEAEGAIRLGRPHIAILDRERLKRLALT